MSTGFIVSRIGGYTADLDDILVRRESIAEGNRWGWGANSSDRLGTLGDGTSINKSSPVTVSGSGNNWRMIATGSENGGGIKSDGSLWMNGIGFYGTNGDGTATDRLSPVSVAGGGSDWKYLDVGGAWAGAIKTDGTLWTWGIGNDGRTGLNTTANVSSPNQISGGGSNWASVVTNGPYGLALKTDGSLWSWGSPTNGRTLSGTVSRSSPGSVTVGGITNWKQISCAYTHAGGVRTDGTLLVWGFEQYGRLGNNNDAISSISSPVTISGGGTNWKQLSCGYAHNAAVKTDGTLWSWGRNNLGQLGDGTTVNKSSPISIVNGGTNWKKVSCGQTHALSIKTDGSIWSWGYNAFGELGDGTTVNKSSPVQIGTSVDWFMVSAGFGSPNGSGNLAIKE